MCNQRGKQSYWVNYHAYSLSYYIQVVPCEKKVFEARTNSEDAAQAAQNNQGLRCGLHHSLKEGFEYTNVQQKASVRQSVPNPYPVTTFHRKCLFFNIQNIPAKSCKINIFLLKKKKKKKKNLLMPFWFVFLKTVNSQLTDNIRLKDCATILTMETKMQKKVVPIMHVF